MDTISLEPALNVGRVVGNEEVGVRSRRAETSRAAVEVEAVRGALRAACARAQDVYVEVGERVGAGLFDDE